MVFVGGLHRSGTSIMARTLETHPLLGGLHDTGAPEDEGQHLQSLYPTARHHGGPGRFAFDPAAHLTEQSVGDAEADSTRLVACWLPFADCSRPFVVEKSPPNLIRTRYLQALFPDARFVLVVRHPAVVAVRTRVWRRDLTIADLLRHWICAHDRMVRDQVMLRRSILVRYESFVDRPIDALTEVADLVGVDPDFDVSAVVASRSDRAFEEWMDLRRSLDPSVMAELDQGARRHGYRLDRLAPSSPELVSSRAAGDVALDARHPRSREPMTAPLLPDTAIANRRWIRRDQPFPHVVADDVFTPGCYQAFADAALEIVSGDELGYLPAHDTFHRRLSADVDSPLSFFLSDAWRDVVAGLVGATPFGGVLCGVHHHAVGSADGEPHTDLRRRWWEDGMRQQGRSADASTPRDDRVPPRRERVRAVALLYYLANDPWRPGDGGETALYRSGADPVHQPHAVVEPLNNRLLAFECTPVSFHSFLSNTRNPRNSLIMWVYRRPVDLLPTWSGLRRAA